MYPLASDQQQSALSEGERSKPHLYQALAGRLQTVNTDSTHHLNQKKAINDLILNLKKENQEVKTQNEQMNKQITALQDELKMQEDLVKILHEYASQLRKFRGPFEGNGLKGWGLNDPLYHQNAIRAVI